MNLKEELLNVINKIDFSKHKWDLEFKSVNGSRKIKDINIYVEDTWITFEKEYDWYIHRERLSLLSVKKFMFYFDINDGNLKRIRLEFYFDEITYTILLSER